MSNFAVIPWSEQFNNDGIFDINSPHNHDYSIEPYDAMRKEFELLGHTIHTIDLYQDYSEIDFFLFLSLDWRVHHMIVRMGMSSKMVYCTAEPPSVYSYNTPSGYRILKRIFPYILTWNTDWVDDTCIFKRSIPYWFVDQRDGALEFNNRKLLTFISSNKESKYPGELYSERKKAIKYYEISHSNEFDFYGVGWNKQKHLCYRGKIKNKSDIYHKYRFAICYENIEGMRGYITEKIFDCLTSGIVPIYAGAPDICDYVPKGCFISLREYNDYESLYNYISNMKEDEYKNYLKAADEFMHSPMSDHFSGKKYAHYILDAVSHDKSGFKSSKIAYKLFKYKYHRYF